MNLHDLSFIQIPYCERLVMFPISNHEMSLDIKHDCSVQSWWQVIEVWNYIKLEFFYWLLFFLSLAGKKRLVFHRANGILFLILDIDKFKTSIFVCNFYLKNSSNPSSYKQNGFWFINLLLYLSYSLLFDWNAVVYINTLGCNRYFIRLI